MKIELSFNLLVSCGLILLINYYLIIIVFKFWLPMFIRWRRGVYFMNIII